MVITNSLNLPQALVDACDVSPHNAPFNVSATTLKNGVREILLTKRHWEEMSDDVSNRIWALFGTAVHALLEKESANTFVEENFKQQIGKYTVTGRIDCYDMKNGVIYDYKTASTWKYKFADYEDWRFQGLVYAWLLRQNGFEANKCRFVMFFKDFSQTKAKTEQGYPQKPVAVYEFNVTEKDLEEIEKEIYDKVKLLEQSETIADELLPICSEQERWARPDTWAVMKKGRKTAIRVFQNKEDAELMLSSCDKDCYIQERKGESTKCNGYCGCCEFCDFYKKLNQPSVEDVESSAI